MKKNKMPDSDILKLILILLFFVILTLAVGIWFKNRATPKILTEYSNGFIFTKASNSKFWSTTVINSETRQEIGINNLRYSPSEVKDVVVIGDPRIFLQRLTESQANAAYFTYVPERNTSNAAASYGNSSYVTLTYADLTTFLKKINGISLVLACTRNETGYCEENPTVTCENQQDKSMVVYLKPGNTTKLIMENTCLIIEGNGLNLAKAYNKLFFIWYNII